MPNASYVYSQVRAPVDLVLDAPATLTVNCDGFDTLMLQIAYTYDSGTALSFSFADADGINDSGNVYTKAKVNYSTNAIEFAPAFSGNVTGDVFATIPFSLTGVGLSSSPGNVEITVTCTGGTTSDLMTVTPIVAKTV